MELRNEIDYEFAKELGAKMGYHFRPARIDRIARCARQLIDAGDTVPSAFAEALEVDLLMYGDPKAYDPRDVVSGYEYL